MTSINSVTLTGYLGAAPDIQESRGTTFARFRMATNAVWTANGERRERTDWHQVVAFNGLAKSLAHLAKGDQVAVHGRLQTSQWERDGQKRTTVEIVASEVEFLRLKDRAPAAEPAASPKGRKSKARK